MSTGEVLSVKVPSPNLPLKLYPQAHSVPSGFNAKLCTLPAEMLAQSVAVPNCPVEVCVHSQMLPSARSPKPVAVVILTQLDAVPNCIGLSRW